ncbi:D-glutamate cyclase, mitochondrial [Holothuria leucospilota]|uniref:D-glutamate cyclase, mitochondrial n=1 Tax=Holothuria leucospilota TaxID=206669 RepID=A0A9Q1CI50_HOLLE|nr:D-glutamate cyclase, mitochondrial [Holothuria leucospilota]
MFGSNICVNMNGNLDKSQDEIIGSQEMDLTKASPETLRAILRKGKLKGLTTAGICQGHVQANLVMLPKEFSEDFENFCLANWGPLPLLFASKAGQFDAPPLRGKEPSDIRTDLPAYNVFKNGEFSRTVYDLLEFGDSMNHFCFFYLGCSFSFDQALLTAGVPLRNITQHGNVSMYRTNIRCQKVGKFDCQQIVSLRFIPEDKVQLAYEVTHPCKDTHGAPVHIGNPAVIGIKDVKKPDYGPEIIPEPGDVPVFWSCGVTGLEAVKSINAPLTFTHCPGSMFITDNLSQKECVKSASLVDQPRVIWLSHDPPLASALSQTAEAVIRRLEVIGSDDPGKRNISQLVVPGDLLKSALSLSHASSVALVTGFPAFCDQEVPFETDGPPGAIALALFLQQIGKEVTFIVDPLAGFDKAMESVLDKLVAKGVVKKPFPVLMYPKEGCSPTNRSAALSFLTVNGDIHCPRFDHIVAIERAGRAADGNYYTCKAKNVSHLVTDLDVLFEVAQQIPLTFTTGIGDGGNELGMGKVHDIIKQHIPMGEKIASSVAANFLVTCGVSNWGGYALCMALYTLWTDPVHDRYHRRAVGFPQTDKEKTRLRSSLPQEKQEEVILKTMVKHDFKDVSGQACMAVDGMDFYKVHVPKLEEMMQAVCSGS